MALECDYIPPTSDGLVLGAYYKYLGDADGEHVWFGPSEDVKTLADAVEKNNAEKSPI